MRDVHRHLPRWARSPAERIAIKRGPGKCSMSPRCARIVRMAAKRRWACATTRSCEPTTATSPGFNGDFLCVKGRFAFDFTRHPERLKQPLVRRNGKLEPASWEDVLAEAASRLAAVRAKSGPDAIGFYGSNRTTNEENYLLGRIARAAIGTNNVDHHRTADYAGLVTLPAGPASPAPAPGEIPQTVFPTMGDLALAPAFLLLGNDASEQNPLVAWQIRSALRHHGSHLYIVDSREPKLARKANAVPAGRSRSGNCG